MVLVIAYNLRKQPENDIIQVKMLACKGIFTPYFNRNAFFGRKTRATPSQKRKFIFVAF